MVLVRGKVCALEGFSAANLYVVINGTIQPQINEWFLIESEEYSIVVNENVPLRQSELGRCHFYQEAFSQEKYKKMKFKVYDCKKHVCGYITMKARLLASAPELKLKLNTIVGLSSKSFYFKGLADNEMVIDTLYKTESPKIFAFKVTRKLELYVEEGTKVGGMHLNVADMKDGIFILKDQKTGDDLFQVNLEFDWSFSRKENILKKENDAPTLNTTDTTEQNIRILHANNKILTNNVATLKRQLMRKEQTIDSLDSQLERLNEENEELRKVVAYLMQISGKNKVTLSVE